MVGEGWVLGPLGGGVGGEGGVSLTEEQQEETGGCGGAHGDNRCVPRGGGDTHRTGGGGHRAEAGW